MTTKQLLEEQKSYLQRDAERVCDNLIHSAYSEPDDTDEHAQWEEENLEGVQILDELNQEIELVNDLLTNYFN